MAENATAVKSLKFCEKKNTGIHLSVCQKKCSMTEEKVYQIKRT